MALDRLRVPLNIILLFYNIFYVELNYNGKNERMSKML